ncbi:MAG: sigma-70 family RNA polymerase sigma factor [Anaerolineaceae bacterium]
METIKEGERTNSVSREEEVSIVEEARRNPQSFSLLYHRYVKQVFYYFVNRVGDSAIAEDLTSQTFLLALQSLKQLHRNDRFAPWLFSIARNQTTDYYRKSSREISFEPEMIAEIFESTESHASVVDKTDLILLQNLVHRLPERDQEMLRLRFVGELTFAQIAIVLRQTENKVKKAYYRLLSQLEKEIEGNNE